ncbi:Arc family DNA-binding protein [Brucella lupini]
MAKQDDYMRYTIRVPSGVYQHIQDAAESAGRSVNAEIIERLENSIQKDESLVEVTEKAVETLERMNEEARLDLAQLKAMASQIKMMRYLLDQVAINKNNLPKELIAIIEILAEVGERQIADFDVDRFQEIFDESRDAHTFAAQLAKNSTK